MVDPRARPARSALPAVRHAAAQGDDRRPDRMLVSALPAAVYEAWRAGRRKPTKGAEMKLAVVGRGNVGGGLADLWEAAGHEVTRIGREGGEVSDAEVVLIA